MCIKINQRVTNQELGAHPSWLERLIHLVDMGTQFWDIDISETVHEVIQNEAEYQRFMNSVININPASEHYVPVVDVNFPLQVDRIIVDENYKGFNFIPHVTK